MRDCFPIRIFVDSGRIAGKRGLKPGLFMKVRSEAAQTGMDTRRIRRFGRRDRRIPQGANGIETQSPMEYGQNDASSND
jgi:hypothetical protein